MPDLSALIQTIGYLGIFAIIFAESGVFIGLFLPGDSLLFTAGLLANQGSLQIELLIIGIIIAAVLGDNFGYAFGRRVGPAIFKKEDSLLFHKDHLIRAKDFYEKHGGKTIILARFMPIIRTFAPILAGVGKMKYSHFIFYNFVGALIWTVSITGLGYYLGKVLPNSEKFIFPIILFIVLASLLPTFISIIRNEKYRKEIIRQLYIFFSKFKKQK